MKHIPTNRFLVRLDAIQGHDDEREHFLYEKEAWAEEGHEAIKAVIDTFFRENPDKRCRLLGAELITPTEPDSPHPQSLIRSI